MDSTTPTIDPEPSWNPLTRYRTTKARHAATESQIALLTEANAVLQDDINTARSETADIETEIEAMRTELEGLQVETKKLKSDQQVRVIDLDQRLNKARSYTRHITNLSRHVQSLLAAERVNQGKEDDATQAVFRTKAKQTAGVEDIQSNAALRSQVREFVTECLAEEWRGAMSNPPRTTRDNDMTLALLLSCLRPRVNYLGEGDDGWILRLVSRRDDDETKRYSRRIDSPRFSELTIRREFERQETSRVPETIEYLTESGIVAVQQSPVSQSLGKHELAERERLKELLTSYDWDKISNASEEGLRSHLEKEFKPLMSQRAKDKSSGQGTLSNLYFEEDVTMNGNDFKVGLAWKSFDGFFDHTPAPSNIDVASLVTSFDDYKVQDSA